MILIIFNGSSNCLKAYEEYAVRGVDFQCLQFYSDVIPKKESKYSRISHVYIKDLGKTKAKAKVNKQNLQMIMASIGFAKGVETDTIIVCEPPTEEMTNIGLTNNINVVYPFIDNEKL